MSSLVLAAGALRHRLELQAEVQTSDGQGGYVRTWQTSATVWGSVEPLVGRERWAAQQVQSPATHKIRLRYRDGVTTTVRIKFGTRTFNVREVLNLEERKVILELMAEENTGA